MTHTNHGVSRQQALRQLLRARAVQAPRGGSGELARVLKAQSGGGIGKMFGGKARGQAPDYGGQRPLTHRQHSPFQRRTSAQSGQSQMLAGFDRIVAASLMHGQQTSGVLRTLFRLTPSLIGR